MTAGTHLGKVAPGACIACHDNRGLCFVGEYRAGTLLHFFAQVGFGLGGQNFSAGLLHLKQTIGQRGVLGGGAFDAIEELGMKEFVLLVFGAFDEAQHAPRHEALAELGIVCDDAVRNEIVVWLLHFNIIRHLLSGIANVYDTYWLGDESWLTWAQYW